MTSTGMGVPGFTHKEYDFSTILELYGMFIFLPFLNITYDETILVWHVKTVCYFQPRPIIT